MHFSSPSFLARQALALPILLIAACGGAGTSSDWMASITSLGANATHDHYSGGVAIGDWQGNGPQNGTLTAVSVNSEQALSIALSGPTPTTGATYSLTGSGSGIKYGDAPGPSPTRVWDSVAGSATVDSIVASTSDHSKTLHVIFSNVTAQPAADANANTAIGSLTLQGSALIDGVYLP